MSDYRVIITMAPTNESTPYNGQGMLQVKPVITYVGQKVSVLNDARTLQL